MIVAERELVIHTKFGGFQVNAEMAIWLMENKGWIIVDNKNYDYQHHTTLCDLIDCGSDYFSPSGNNESQAAFRMNPDLIECVRALQEKHKNDSFSEKHYGYIHGLRVVKVVVNLDVENYQDGKEQVSCWHHIED